MTPPTAPAGFVWLASYPKSGNTWLRIALASLARGGMAVRMNDVLADTRAGATRRLFDRLCHIDSADLAPDEVMAARPYVYRRLMAAGQGPWLCKVHDARIETPNGPLFPADVTRGAIHIVRDPRDVAISFARHLGEDVDRTIERMANPAFGLDIAATHLSRSLPQAFGTWSDHTRSWMALAEFPVVTIRFEDMLADPAAALIRATGLTGMPTTSAAIQGAVIASSFSTLAGQEADEGFREASHHAGRFFHRGTAGGWREVLTSAQCQRIEHHHGDVMARLGYL